MASDEPRAENTTPRTQPTVTMNVTLSGRVRRLPVYLLLDCSGSMRGAPIGAVQVGIEQFLSDVREDPQACDTVHVGVITFNDTAELITRGLVPVERFAPPKLTAGGHTCLGKALRVLQESLDHDIIRRIPGGPLGDFKPLVFVLTDGEPTDTDVWPVARREMLQRVDKQLLHVVTVGCGPMINEDNLRTIAIGDTYYFKTDDMSKSFGMFFAWVSQSTIHYTATLTEGGYTNTQSRQKPPIVTPHTQVFQFVR